MMSKYYISYKKKEQQHELLFHGNFIGYNYPLFNTFNFLVSADSAFPGNHWAQQKKWEKTILLSPTLITEVTALDFAGWHARQVNHSSVWSEIAWVALPVWHPPKYTVLYLQEVLERHITRGRAHWKA